MDAPVTFNREAMTALLRGELRNIRPALPTQWPDDALFKADLEFDSLDLVELVARIEQQFELMIPDADLARFVSTAAMADYLIEKIRA